MRNGPIRPTNLHLFFSVLLRGAFLLASLSLVLCVVQGISGYPFRATIALDPAKFYPAGGFAYSSPLRARYSPRGSQTASVNIRENGKIFSVYSPREVSVAGVGQGIFSVPEQGRLVFSTTDGSDPRTNGRNYSVDSPLRVSKVALSLCFAVWLITGAFLFLRLRDRREIVSLWRRRLAIGMGSIVRFFGKWPATLLSVPSIYLLSRYPPLWKDVDALAQLVLPAGDLNILHFPPVYCFLGRIPFVIAFWLTGDHRTLASLFAQQEPSLTGIYLLVVIQHALLIGAMTYTVISVTQNRMLRCFFALLLASQSALYTQAQCCGSEALSVSATFTIMAAGFSILRGSGPVAWFIYGVALFFAIGSRHINLLFAAWLPATLALLGMAVKVGWCSSSAKEFCWRALGAATSIGLVAIGLNYWIARSLIAADHDEYRSTLGRTLSDRIGTFLDELPATERLGLAQNLGSKTPDPGVRYAIESQATVGPFYKGSAQAIAEHLARSSVPAQRISAERDRVVLAAATRYLMTFHPVLISVIWKDFVKGLVHTDTAQVALSPFRANVFCALDKIKRPDAWFALRALPGVDIVQATVVADAASRDPYVILGRKIPVGFLIVLAVFLGGISCVIDREISGTVFVGWSVLAAGVVVFAATVICVYYMERYTLPLFIAAVFALFTALARLAERGFEWLTIESAVPQDDPKYIING
jgi:hypothetical protein